MTDVKKSHAGSAEPPMVGVTALVTIDGGGTLDDNGRVVSSYHVDAGKSGKIPSDSAKVHYLNGDCEISDEKVRAGFEEKKGN